MYFVFDRRDRNCMSRTAQNSEIQMRWFPNEGQY